MAAKMSIKTTTINLVRNHKAATAEVDSLQILVGMTKKNKLSQGKTDSNTLIIRVQMMQGKNSLKASSAILKKQKMPGERRRVLRTRELMLKRSGGNLKINRMNGMRNTRKSLRMAVIILNISRWEPS
jgi:hypothetical protein